MTHELDVLPVMRDPERPQYRDTHENILSPPFRLALVGASKSGKCLSPNGKILLTTGEIKLENVKIGDMVFTKEGFSKVLDVIHNGEKVVYDVFFTENYKVVCSEEHKIDTTNGLKRLRDLTSKDVIITDSSKGTTVRLVGYNNPRKEMTMDIEVDNVSHTFYYNNVSVSNSNLLMNYLRPCYYGGSKKQNVKPCFNKIVVFSPNLGMDSTTRSLNDLCAEGDIHMTYSDHILQGLMDSQKLQEPSARDRVLIIADDLIAMGCQPQSLIFSSTTYLRHLDISIMYLTQTYRGHYSLSPIVRNNLDGLIMFKCPSFHQVNSLTEDLQGTFGTKQNVKALLSYATQKPYHFCFFNYRDLTVWHNHTEFLWEKYDENGNYNPEFRYVNNDDDKEN